jgi:hypothetical protein
MHGAFVDNRPAIANGGNVHEFPVGRENPS